jgi:hypothetical protein
MHLRAWILASWLALTPSHAAWSDLRAGMEMAEVQRLVGEPLIASRVRGGLFVTWTYDQRGYVLFEHGRLRFWQPSASVAR